MSYQHMNPDPVQNVPKVENGGPTVAIEPSKRIVVPILPSVPKSNDYTEYKVPSYQNEVNTKVHKKFQKRNAKQLVHL